MSIFLLLSSLQGLATGGIFLFYLIYFSLSWYRFNVKKKYIKKNVRCACCEPIPQPYCPGFECRWCCLECEGDTSTTSSLVSADPVHLWAGWEASLSRPRCGTWALWKTTRADTSRRFSSDVTCAGCWCSFLSTSRRARCCAASISARGWRHLTSMPRHCIPYAAVSVPCTGWGCHGSRGCLPFYGGQRHPGKYVERCWQHGGRNASNGPQPLTGPWCALRLADTCLQSTPVLRQLER